MITKIQNAVIEKASITCEDGVLDCWLTLDYGDCGHQGFGGYALYLPKSHSYHEVKSVAGHHIYRCLEIAGVSRWSDVVGKTIRVKIVDGLIDSIGHIVKSDWYSPKIEFNDALESKESK